MILNNKRIRAYLGLVMDEICPQSDSFDRELSFGPHIAETSWSACLSMLQSGTVFSGEEDG